MERADAARSAQVHATVRSADLAAEIGAALALTRSESATPVLTLAGLELTRREREVLPMMAADRSNHEIADELFVSLDTIKVHVTHILAKLDVKSRAGTVYAHRRQLA
jgi:DNA-binding NarL/FixJ family response regulator